MERVNLTSQAGNIDSRVFLLELKSRNQTPVEETLTKASFKLEKLAAAQETPMVEDQFYQQGLVTEVKMDPGGEDKKPTSKAVKPQSLTQELESDQSDEDPQLVKPAEPPDIEEVMERVLKKQKERIRTGVLEEVRQHLLLVGAIKDEDIRRHRG